MFYITIFYDICFAKINCQRLGMLISDKEPVVDILKWSVSKESNFFQPIVIRIGLLTINGLHKSQFNWKIFNSSMTQFFLFWNTDFLFFRSLPFKPSFDCSDFQPGAFGQCQSWLETWITTCLVQFLKLCHNIRMEMVPKMREIDFQIFQANVRSQGFKKYPNPKLFYFAHIFPIVIAKLSLNEKG